MKINNFQGDLTDISAKKEALVAALQYLQSYVTEVVSGKVGCSSYSAIT